MGEGESYALLDDADAKAWLELLSEKIEKVEGASEDYATLLSIFVFKDVIDHFKKEKGPEEPWAPWGDAYRKHMEKIGKGGNKLLQDTGRLRDSFTPNKFRTSKEGVTWYNPAKTSEGFPYAAHHNQNAYLKRTFMWLSAKALGQIADATLDFILE